MSHPWPWRWDARPHGWHVTPDGRDCYGPLPEATRKTQPAKQARIDRTPEEQAATLTLERARRAERARLIDPWRRS